MAGPIKFFSSDQKILGIDIGTASVKAVELRKSKKGIELVNYGILEAKGHLEKVNKAIQTSSLEIIDTDTAGIIRTLLENMGTSTKDVAASLPAFSAFTSLLEMPDMTVEETAQAMQYQAKSIVPMPINQVALDWIKVERRKNEQGNYQQRVLLIAIPKKQIQKYQNIFRQAGLNLRILEIETVSLARALTKGDKTLSLIVDIGARSTAFAIARGGMLMHSTQADFAGSSLTYALANGLSINMARAEELKKQKGLLGKGGDYDVSTLMLPYLDVIISEAKRVIEGYRKSHQGSVERIILSGGGANLLGVVERLADHFGYPAVVADPFGGKISYPQSAAPVLKNTAPALSVAVGLGERALSG